MRNAPAFVIAALAALIFMDMPGTGYFLAGAGFIVFGPFVAGRVAEGLLWIVGALLDACRAPPARIVAIIAGLSALGAGAVAACAEPLAREPTDVVYMPSLAIRADGRLVLAADMTIAEAARAYAGPPAFWAATCRATLPGWRWPVDWQWADWRASISDRGAVVVSGLATAEAAHMRALLVELVPIVACGE